MKTGAIIIALVFALAAAAGAGEKWTTTDVLLETTFVAGLAMDYAQTQHIARNPTKYTEENPILGEHPSKGRVNAYYVGVGALHVWGADQLEGWKRTAWQLLGIAAEAYTVRVNRRASNPKADGTIITGIGIILHF